MFEFRLAYLRDKMLANHALVLLVGVATDGAFDVAQPGLKILFNGQVSRSGKNHAIRVAHSLAQDSPAFALCLRANPTPSAIGSEVSAPVADDFALLVSARRFPSRYHALSF